MKFARLYGNNLSPTLLFYPSELSQPVHDRRCHNGTSQYTYNIQKILSACGGGEMEFILWSEFCLVGDWNPGNGTDFDSSF